MTDIEKRILENQEVILAALSMPCGDILGVDSFICYKLYECYDATRLMLGKPLHLKHNRYEDTYI